MKDKGHSGDHTFDKGIKESILKFTDDKTGRRTTPLIVSFPYLRENTNNHPFVSNPNAFVEI